MNNLPLFLCCLFGVINFFLHKAVVESQHPFVEDTKYYFGRYLGPHGSYAIEFALLLGAMAFAAAGSWLILLIYIGYTVFNIVAAWMLLSGRI
jgi:ABC-type transport system involved in cytochrome bd biosynthesis fused ATPase/permease subunit